MIVGISYFTKWIKVKPIGRIREEEIIQFIRKNIIHFFDLPKELVTDNEKQFMGYNIKYFSTKYNIKMCHSKPYYRLVNSQEKSSNKFILNMLKTILETTTNKMGG